MERLIKVSVLNWNESLQNIQESDSLFMVRFTTNTTSNKNRRRPRNSSFSSSSFEDSFKVSEFDNISLSTLDSMAAMVSQSIKDCLNFVSEEEEPRVRRRLTSAISAYLFGYFTAKQYELQETEKPPRIIIVVDLQVPTSTQRTFTTRYWVRHPRLLPSCVPGDLSIREVQKIRRTLLFLLREPVLLGGEPLNVIGEPSGV